MLKLDEFIDEFICIVYLYIGLKGLFFLHYAAFLIVSN